MTADNLEKSEIFVITDGCLVEVKAPLLKEIVVPDGVTCVDSNAFSHCPDAENIILPDSVSIIAEKAFSGLGRLEFVRLPSRLDRIESELFSGCTALKNIDLPQTLVIVGPNAFKNCTSLSEIRLPASARQLQNGCFTNCSSLKDIQFSQLDVVSELVFAGCSALTRVVLPDSVQSVGQMAFKNCSNLRFVHLPNGLKVVSNQLFAGCHCLDEVEVPDDAEMGKSVFLRVLSADNWERFVRKKGICRRTLVNAMDVDPYGAFDMLPEGGAGLAGLLPQRTIFVTLNAIWEYTQFEESSYNFQISIFAACMRIARYLTENNTASILAVTWHLRGLLLLWRYRHEEDFEKVFPEALAATLNAIGGNGAHRAHTDKLVREMLKIFISKLSDDVRLSIEEQFDVILGIENDYTRENPYELRYAAGLAKADYWLFSDVMGYLTRYKFGVHIPIPEVQSDDIEDWCAAWSKPIGAYLHAVILFELPPAKDETENRHAVAIVSNLQLNALIELFQEVNYHDYYVWTDGARMPFFLVNA